MKRHEKHHEQISSPAANSEAEVLQHAVEHTSNSKKRRKKRRDSFVVYEESDLRGIVAKALTESTDPYHALSEAGVIKSAAEYFKGDYKEAN